MIEERTSTVFAENALLPSGWASDVVLKIGADGTIRDVLPGATYEAGTMSRISGPVLPGMSNLHSHAHQRGMAGLSEYRASGADAHDSFWTWRTVMHAFAPQLTPPMLETIATQLYIEMLKAGYTSVCEFHYVHHQKDGTPYGDPAEMAHALVRAARSAGIGLTLLPVLYSRGGYGDRPANDGQRRFISTPDVMADMFRALFDQYGDDDDVVIGVAPHSPRQVTKDAMVATLGALQEYDNAAPIHIHVAEQTSDVEESIAYDGMRPVEWVFDHFDVDERWCLVHATHVLDAEVDMMATSNAVVGLCPTTEANLGDGLFPLSRYLKVDGRFGIGSDSNISISVVEELRWLEYGQRLIERKRNLAAVGPGGSTGRRLFDAAVAGGAQAAGRRTGQIAPGYIADLIALTPDSPWMAHSSGDRVLDGLIFAGNDNLIRDVWVGGKRVIEGGQHILETSARAAFKVMMNDLVS